MVFRKKKKQPRPSNVSPKSFDVLVAKMEHHLKDKPLLIPTSQKASWEELRRANPWILDIETDVISLFNGSRIPHLDSYAAKLIKEWS